MASAFGHAFAAYSLGTSFSRHTGTRKFFLLGIICSIIPDADVLAFVFEIPYESFWGHRGFTHSLVFALGLAVVITSLFHRKELRPARAWIYILYYFLCTASHGLLDALTSGGLGVAFFSPFVNERYFFPYRPIKVSPIGVGNFFSEWGLKVLWSELLWIGIPFGAYMIIIRLFCKRK